MNDEAAEYLRRLVAENPELARKSFYRRSEVHAGTEWFRIVSLPRRALDLENTPDLTPLWQRSQGTMQLWPVQSAALLEAEVCDGLFVSIPVGGGKTLLATLLPEALRSKQAVILVPAQMKRKTLQEVWPDLQRHFTLPLDRVTLVSYTQLERGESNILDDIKPDLVIADEAHYLKNKDARRTWRVLDYFKRNAETRFVAMSGTFTSQSLHDYAHLIKLCLRERSPLPADYMTLSEWAEAIDVSDDPRPAGALERLCEDINHVHEHTRHRFACRLVSSPGVVALPSGYRDTALTVRRRALEASPKIAATIDRLRETWTIDCENWQASEGTEKEAAEEVNDDLTFARYLRQLACGFYLRWDWPGGHRDSEWLEARSEWNRVVRHVLRYSRRPGLDSPMLVASAGHRGVLAREHQSVWDRWAAVKGRRKPPTVAVWLDDYLIRDCVRWSCQSEGNGIVWYESPTLGEAIAKELGTELPEKAIDIKPGGPLVLSVLKFGTGVDGLQKHYHRALYTTVPNAKQMEQSLGRIHRPGQRREVMVDMLMPIAECFDAFAVTREKAEYAESTGFGEQKILHCQLEGFE